MKLIEKGAKKAELIANNNLKEIYKIWPDKVYLILKFLYIKNTSYYG